MEEKQLEIVQKASEIFMKYGIKAVTMDDLARELSISKKTIYKYFDDKKDLVRSIVRAKTEYDVVTCNHLIHHSENAIDELIQISRMINENFGMIHSSVFFDLQKYHKDAWSILQDHKQQFVHEQIMANMKRGIQEELYRNNIKVDLVAFVYINTIDTVFEKIESSTIEYTVSEIFVEIIRFLIRGIASEKGLEYLKLRINKEKNV